MRHSCIILRLCIYIDVKTVMFFKTFRGREMTIWNRCFACPIEFWHHSWSDFLPRQQKTTHQLTSLLYRLIYFCHVTFFQSWKKSFEWKNNVKIQYYFSLPIILFPFWHYSVHLYWNNFFHLVSKNLIKYMRCFKNSFEPCTANDK